MKKCCFTGHRPRSLPWGYNEKSLKCFAFKKELKKVINNVIDSDNVSYFITGMAMGVDIMAGEIIAKEKIFCDNLFLEAAIPCKNQTEKWKQEYIDRYEDLLEYCDKITYVSEDYTSDCMLKRNKYMVDNSDIVIAVWDGRSGSGTGATVNYARKQGKKVIIIPIKRY